ncbi:hypothetical protein TeGR_g7514 [Tetraparma gracilis]|uniref:Uncharacterized protein n=1 Tax=Tetraparma gracilis TaxID=2962635 RepID=A0ABQ6NB89_9STRA|nr:hypothetical protein TeGR_g7514 [Tetraparma gracilis]
MAEFEKELEQLTPKVYAELDLDKEDVEQATNYYYERDEETVTRAVNKLKNLYKQIGGTPPSSGPPPPDVDLPKFVEICREYFAAMTSTMQSVLDEVRESAGLPPHADIPASEVPAVQKMFGSRVEADGAAALKGKFGVTLDAFQTLMDKYQRIPQVGQVLGQLQMQQQAQFEQMGLKEGMM